MSQALRRTPITLSEAVERVRLNREGFPTYQGNYRHVEYSTKEPIESEKLDLPPDEALHPSGTPIPAILSSIDETPDELEDEEDP